MPGSSTPRRSFSERNLGWLSPTARTRNEGRTRNAGERREGAERAYASRARTQVGAPFLSEAPLKKIVEREKINAETHKAGEMRKASWQSVLCHIEFRLDERNTGQSLDVRTSKSSCSAGDQVAHDAVLILRCRIRRGVAAEVLSSSPMCRPTAGSRRAGSGAAEHACRVPQETPFVNPPPSASCLCRARFLC